MSNHLHVIFACRDISQAIKTVRLYKQLLAQYLKFKYGLTKVMHCTDDSIVKIDTVQYLLNCIAYVFRNPVSAKICKKPEEYMWSSYSSCFSKDDVPSGQLISELGFSKKRAMLRTAMDLTSCPFQINDRGMIALTTFVRNDIVERAFRNSGKSFLYH